MPAQGKGDDLHLVPQKGSVPTAAAGLVLAVGAVTPIQLYGTDRQQQGKCEMHPTVLEREK